MDAAFSRSAPTYHSEELDAGLCRLARGSFASTALADGEGFDHVPLQQRAARLHLQQRIKGGDELCSLRVSPTDVAKAYHFGIVELHGAARHRHFAEIEELPGAAGATAYHDQADFRPAQKSIRDVAGMLGPGLLELAQVGPRQYSEPTLPWRQVAGLTLVPHVALPTTKIPTSIHLDIC
jgi:hypothetical protein